MMKKENLPKLWNLGKAKLKDESELFQFYFVSNFVWMEALLQLCIKQDLFCNI